MKNNMQFYKNNVCLRINRVLVVIYVSIFVLVYYGLYRKYKVDSTNKQPQILRFNDDNNSLYIMIKPLDPDEVPGNTSIFFIETSRRPEKITNLTVRQACSIESAAR